MPSRPLGKGHSGLICVHDLYWGGKHAAGEEREQARAGRGEPGMFLPAAGRGRGRGEKSPPPRAARGPGSGRLRAAAGGAAARGFRERGARVQGPVAPVGARARRCPPPNPHPTPGPRRPRRRQLPARRARRRAGRKTRSGAGADGVGAARRAPGVGEGRGDRERSGGAPAAPRARTARNGQAPGSRTWLGPRCAAREPRAKSPSGLGGTESRWGTARLPLPGARRSITDLNHFWKSDIFQAFVKQSLLLF